MNHTLPKNYYEILGVDEGAEIEVINAAHKALAKKYHPDTFQGNKKDAEEKLKLINAAHDVLSNPKKRKEYDAKLNKGGKKNNFEDSNDFDANFDGEPVLKEDWQILIEVYPEAEEMRLQLAEFSPTLSFSYQIQLLVSKNADKAVIIAELIAKDFFEKYFGTNIQVHILVKELLINKKRHIAKEINKKITLLGTNSSQKIIQDIEVKYARELAEMRFVKPKRPYPGDTSSSFKQPSNVETTSPRNVRKKNRFVDGVIVVIFLIAMWIFLYG